MARSRTSAKTHLNFWVMPNAGFATRSILKPLIDEFEREHPSVNVHLTVHPWSLSWNGFMDVIKCRHMGPMPDVLQVGTTWVATLSYLGALEPVPEKIFSDDEKKSAYIWDPGDQSETSHDLYCVPWFIDVRVLYYRRDIFDALRLSPSMLNDWKGFSEACEAIRRAISKDRRFPRLVAPVAMPGQKPAILMHDLAPWVWSAGGDFCSYDLNEVNLLQPALIKGCAFYFDMINGGHMPLPTGAVQGGNFFTGQHAMQFSGSWPVDTLLNPESPYASREVAENAAVALFPSGPQGRYTFLGGSNLSVASASPNKEIAWEFLRFLLDPERQLRHARHIGALPARLASAEQLFDAAPAAKKVFWDSMQYARRLPRLIELGSIEQIVTKMGGRVLDAIRDAAYNEKTLMSEMRAAHAEIEALAMHRYGQHASKGAVA